MASLKIEHSSSYIPERFHNKWNNDFVQSLETPYEGSEYRESVETLVNEVKILLKEMQTGFDGDLIERFEMVDALQCFGIDRYFQTEIKEALDYVYRCWDGSVGIRSGSGSVTKNLNATALGVECALLYEWPQTFSRWEARNFIEIYELDNSRLKDKKILELAKLDFNILQFVYKMEMKEFSSWWENSRVTGLISIQQRPIEYYSLAVSAIDEVEFSSSRMALAKSLKIISLMDDLFDDYLAIEQADYVEATIQQTRWNASKYIPTYDEYIQIAATTAAVGPLSLHPFLLAAPDLANNTIEKIFNNQCRFCKIMWLCTRLNDDAHDYQDGKLHGQTVSAISSYMRDHPECSEEETLNHINYIIHQLLEKLSFNLNRGIQCFFVLGDGFSYHDEGMKQRVIKVLIDPVKI
ncbi:hypothetical protein SUGI_0779180 [Cryptomeria japonica]|nr:hypothetical protein SUGI_0779180 [Cryptomeria japonica]